MLLRLCLFEVIVNLRFVGKKSWMQGSSRLDLKICRAFEQLVLRLAALDLG